MTSDGHSDRVETLRRARQRQPWTVNLIAECASDPVAFKDQMSLCDNCSEPCDSDEVCATAIAKSRHLFQSFGRDQTYHLIESGMKRLRIRDEAETRTVDRERPNTFLRLTTNRADQTKSSDENRRISR